MRILVIEDESKISSFIERGLSEQKYAVDVAETGEDGLYMADINPYDLILLDVMLPKKDGFEVCAELRQSGNETPIIMLTARDAVKDRISGLNAGADDYLPKPFAFEELLARMRAILRRKQSERKDKIVLDDLEVDLFGREVKRSGQSIQLTNKEFGLLEYLIVNAGSVVTRTMISEHVWNERFHSMTNVIDVHIRYLRKKIDKPFEKQLIHTVRGAGYMIKNGKTV